MTIAIDSTAGANHQNLIEGVTHVFCHPAHDEGIRDPDSRWQIVDMCVALDTASSCMRDDDQRIRVVRRELNGLLQRFWIERRETLVQNHHVGMLQERTRKKYPASFALRQLPSRLTHRLL